MTFQLWAAVNFLRRPGLVFFALAVYVLMVAELTHERYFGQVPMQKPIVVPIRTALGP